MRNRVLIVMPVLALALAGCDKPAEVPEAIRPVLSMVVEPQASSGARFVGTVESQVSAAMAFRIGGTLLSRNVDVGATVTAGEVLASIESTNLAFAVTSAEATLANAQAQFQNAQATEGRLSTLLQSDTISAANLEQARQQRQAAEASVIQAQSRLTQSRQQLDYTQLTAGFDGVVTAVSADAGQVVTAGQTVLTIARPDVRDIVIDVPDSLAQNLSLGAEFTIELQLAPDVSTTGTLREIAPQADAITRLRRLRIGVTNPPASFWLGTTAIAIAPQDATSAIEIPATAVNATAAPFVWVVNETAGTVAARPVETGEANGSLIPILSGIEPGERIVTAGVHSLTEGQQVKFEHGTAP